jgi:thiosulfate/3-mercaptopyruvate sulfurtransferase
MPGAVWIEWYRMTKPTPAGQAECATVGITPETLVII